MMPDFKTDAEYKAEIRRHDRLIKLFPENLHLLKKRSYCRYGHEDWKKAAKDFEELVKMEPDNFVYWVMLGQSCAHGRLSEKAVKACSRAIELDPDELLPFMHRAWAFRQLKQWDSSIADYTKAIEIDMKGRPSMHAAKYRGELYMEMGEYEKAVDDFSLAISGSQWWKNLYIERGEAYLKLKQYEKVIENANAYMSINEKPDIYFLKQRSLAYEKLGQKEKAKVDLSLIEELKAEQRKESERQEKMLEKQKEISKKASDSRIAKKQRQRNLKEKEKHAAIINQCTAMIELNDRDAKAYCLRGQSLIVLKEYKDAIKDFSRAIQLNRDYAAAYYNRGVCHSNLWYDI